MIKYALKVWDFLDGKKTFIGLAGHFCVSGAESIGLIDAATASTLKAFFGVITGVGAGFKIKKATKR